MYEIKTPLLAESVEAARAVIAGMQTGEMEPAVASRVLSGARVLQAAVATDIKARLAAPKIAAQEAKLIEAARGQDRLAGPASSGPEAA
jgi:hypothetical protein